ncbi:Uma2 family endonuclease [Kitasatospora sp. NPDC088391]|uniref:Uma2 family endonuclease n=1 Tax=Kitasatospora sp. NPDC088391 TaxID=3364074 RepID=UPI003812F7E0
MSALPGGRTYDVADPEAALKYAIQHHAGSRVQIVEGVLEPMRTEWDHETMADDIRCQLFGKVREMGCVMGAGDLDLPGSSNWYIPDIAVVPRALSKGGAALLPDQTLLVVEVTSDSNADTGRVVKRRRYAEYGAPLYLLIDRQDRACTLFSEPGALGYTRAVGPLPFGEPIELPEPFGLRVDTSGF